MNFKKPRQYAEANIQQKSEYYEYENHEHKLGDLNNYEILRKIGRGKYSEVFEGVNLKDQSQQKVVIKILNPVRQKKIKREIKILENLKNHPNIVTLLDVVRDPASKTTSLILEHINNTDHRTLYPSFGEKELQFMIREVLKGLDYSHSKGIIHRDIKPHNIMVNMEKKEVKIIDWGLAEFYFPGKEYNVRVASRYFKAPELLVDYQYYDYSLDIWSLGCLFAGIIFRKEPFFMGNDNYQQLEKITKVLGTEGLLDYLDGYDIGLDPKYEDVLGEHQRVPWKKIIDQNNRHLATDEAISLLEKMLVYDHSKRITAQEALQHPYLKKTDPQ